MSVELGAMLEDFDRRLHSAEQTLTGSDIMGQIGTDPDTGAPVIGGVPITLEPPDAVTDVTVTVGSYFDDIFADVEWEEALEGIVAVSFDVELFLRTAGPTYELLTVTSTGGGNYRFTGLQPNTDYAVRVFPVSNIGRRNTTADYVHFTTGQDSTVPPAPTGAIIARGATTVIVKYTQLTAAEAADVANGNGTYEIQIDTATTFNTANLRSMISGDQIVAFNDVISEATWYARVRAIDSSGNVGPWSANAAPAVAGAVNDSMIVADLNAAKITVGFLSASRIATGSLVADKLATSSLTAATITITASGQIFAGVWPTGALFNAAGIRLYKNGTPTVIMDAATGNATFVGTISASTVAGSTISGTNINGGVITGSWIQTATTNQRVIMTNAGVGGSVTESPSVYFYPTLDAYGVGPARMYSFWNTTSGAGGMVMTSPDAYGNLGQITCGVNPSSGYVQIFGSDFISMFGPVTVFGSHNVTGAKSFQIPHPTKPQYVLRHASLEGPENGVFYRGTGKLVGGVATVVLPDYFVDLTGDTETTVHVTPLLSDENETPHMVVAATRVDGDRFKVRGDTDCEFTYIVLSQRSDIPALVVEEEDVRFTEDFQSEVDRRGQ